MIDDSDIPYQFHLDDGTLVLNGVEPNNDGEYYRAGYDPQGRVIDETGNSFNPHAGSSEKTEGRCNATLNKWEIRYGTRRYCTNGPISGKSVCISHKGRLTEENAAEIGEKASRVLKHGLLSNSMENFYTNIEPDKKIMVWAFFEELCDDSIFNFKPEYVALTIDCSDSDTVPQELLKENGTIEIEVPQPTERIDRALSLWLAAIDRTKMINANMQILSDGLGVPKVTHAEHTEDGFVELKQEEEHHLNLPYSRLSRNIQDLLAYGGVGVEEERTDVPSQVVEIYDNPLADDSFTFEQATDITQ